MWFLVFFFFGFNFLSDYSASEPPAGIITPLPAVAKTEFLCFPFCFEELGVFQYVSPPFSVTGHVGDG